MKQPMIRRRTASVGLLAMLAACSSPKKTPILGVQIPVLPDQSGMGVALSLIHISEPTRPY